MRFVGSYDLWAIVVAYMSIAMVISGVVTAVICLFLNMFVMPFFKSKALSKAWEEGRALEAERIDFNSHKGSSKYDPYNGRYIYGTYKYTYAGKTYKYKGVFISIPPQSITVYFKRNPKNAKVEQDFGFIEHEWKPIFWVLTAVVFVIGWFCL